jgi:hypothetical protein
MFQTNRFIRPVLYVWVILLLSVQAGSAYDKVFGINAGFARSEKSSVYVDAPIDTWLDRSPSIFLSGQYLFKFPESSYLGAYLELERLSLEKKANDFNIFEDIEASGTKIAVGLTWNNRIPKEFLKIVTFEFGGFGGYALAKLTDFDLQKGFDFGVFFGPVFPVSENMEVAAHIVDSYGWYAGDEPGGMQNVQPRFRVQVNFIK